MIGKVSGRVEYRAADHVLIDAGGVGYLVYCSERTLAGLPGPGEAAALYTELVVREDLMQLFGFATLAEREWHRMLTSVQGVGAKAALAILGGLGAEGLARALAVGDATAIRAAPGVGPKIAQRVVLELQAKAPGMMALGPARPARGAGQGGGAAGAPAGAAQAGASEAGASAEALSALANLGYGPSEAAAAVAEAAAEAASEAAAEAASEAGHGGSGAAGTAALIRAALKRLAPRG